VSATSTGISIPDAVITRAFAYSICLANAVPLPKKTAEQKEREIV
jgi:hypothetical protein